jgi:putative DNA primase/helicase
VLTLDAALRLRGLGFDVIPLERGEKTPDAAVLPRGEDGRPSWKALLSAPPTDAQFRAWFGDGADRNAGIVAGDRVVIVDGDTPESLAWMRAHLPDTPMMTRTGRGEHWYYRRPTGEWAHTPIPAFIVVGDLEIEVKRDGQYVVAPGSTHPSGRAYEEVAPWPDTLDALTEYPIGQILLLADPERKATKRPAGLARSIGEGSRNNDLFREGCRLRRLGLDEDEILAALLAVNRKRCDPPLPEPEVEAVARSSARFEPGADTWPATETGDAEFFAAVNADIVRFDHRRRRWLLFDGVIWAPQTDGEIARLALDAVRARQRAAVGNKERLKWALGGEGRRRLDNLLDIARNTKPIADAGDSWDLDPWLVGAQNGVIDLRTGGLRPGRPEDRITLRVRAPFDPEAECPLWDRTIEEIFEGDGSLIAYVDRFIGYSLTGDCREEALAFCWGEGANGKGTLMNTVGWLFGDLADDLPFSAFELHSRASIPNDIAKIVGKRFVTASETGETQQLNESRVKALTGRDPVTARFLYGDFFTFQPVAKFWLAANHKPKVNDDSEGFWRRLHLIPFTASFIGREDKTLKDRLRLEAAGILAREVQGCLAWQREGLNPPNAVRAATKAYRDEADLLAPFFDARCVLHPAAKVQASKLFASYQGWCDECQMRDRERLSLRDFGTRLKKQFASDDGRHVFYKGIGLREVGEDRM